MAGTWRPVKRSRILKVVADNAACARYDYEIGETFEAGFLDADGSGGHCRSVTGKATLVVPRAYAAASTATGGSDALRTPIFPNTFRPIWFNHEPKRPRNAAASIFGERDRQVGWQGCRTRGRHDHCAVAHPKAQGQDSNESSALGRGAKSCTTSAASEKSARLEPRQVEVDPRAG